MWDLKQHGKWEYWGDYYGWKRHDLRFADHARAVNDAPYAVIRFPPRVEETGQRPEKKTDRRLHAGSRAGRSTPSHKASSVNPFEQVMTVGDVTTTPERNRQPMALETVT